MSKTSIVYLSLLIALSFVLIYANPKSSSSSSEEDEEHSKDEIKTWKDYLTTHKKYYDNSNARKLKQKNFIANLRKVNAHNKLYEQGKVSWKRAIHKHSDLTEAEFVKTHCGLL